MESLRDQGHVIEGISNRGYKLLTVGTHLDEQTLKHLLSGYAIHLFDSIDSTNRYAKNLTNDDFHQKSLVLATHQTGGRGRLGRGFYSPQGGLYLSIVLPASFSIHDAMLITSASSVAVMRAIEQICGKKCKVKWVNDLFLGQKKVCGILTEGVLGIESNRLSAVVIGIGLNLFIARNAFPLELREIATSVYDGEQDIPRDFDANALVASIVTNLDALVDAFPDRSFLDQYRSESMVLGKQVRVHQGKTSYLAWARFIDDEAHLVVENEEKGLHTLTSAEISVRLEV